MLKKKLYLLACFAMIFVARPSIAVSDEVLKEKTLVVWALPDNLDQQGGSALTVNNLTFDQFDGVVFAELTPKVWMPGSNHFSRTNQKQENWPGEETVQGDFIQIAVVYRDKSVEMYRNGKSIDRYEVQEMPEYRLDKTGILFGQRHLANQSGYFQGKIRDARIYAEPLSQEAIASMEPGRPLPGIAPWAWWDFSATGIFERTKRFDIVKLSGDAALEDGCLVLKGDAPSMLATKAAVSSSTSVIPSQWSKDEPVPDAVMLSTRILREKMLEDPYRPGYHFAVPEDMGVPGDPNGCFFANGRYHLMYLYERRNSGFCWGHVSSADLVHWRHHPDAIGPGHGDEGCFSGGAFVDDDGTAYLSYWMLWGDKGIGLAKSSDRHYDHWEKLTENPVIRSTEWGITETQNPDGTKTVYGSADPTNIWKKNGKYYICGGNLLVLEKYGRKPDSPEEFQGDHLALLESENLTQWKYKGGFYKRNPQWTDSSEDNMCPSFLPLPASPDGGTPSGKHLLLFISHNKGCQYMVGTYDTQADQFLPENHGRMTWVDNTYFAPEALVDDQGRQIMWAWLLDNPSDEQNRGWSGVYGLPRTLWVGKDGTLRMRPVPELKMLRRKESSWKDIKLESGENRKLEGLVGDSCELQINIAKTMAQQVGIKVRASGGGEEETLLYYDATEKSLVFDSTRSGGDGRKTVEKAPFEWKGDRPLQLRVFVDKSVVEVFADDRQAICRRVYPKRSDSLDVVLFAQGGEATIAEIKAWEMMPSNPY